MGILTMFIQVNDLETKEEAKEISKKLRSQFPLENYSLRSTWQEDLDVDIAEEV